MKCKQCGSKRVTLDGGKCMRCHECGEKVRPTVIARKGYIFYVYLCESNHMSHHGEIVRALLGMHAYSTFETMIRKGIKSTWEEHVRFCIKERGI